MQFQTIFKELTYAAEKVLIYRLIFEDDLTFIGFGRWLGLEYDNARKTWNRGMNELKEKGYLKEDLWTEKAVGIFKRMDSKDME